MKQLVFSISFLAFAAAFAAPQIVVDRVQQRYPWNGLVDIDYTVSGIEATHDANDYFVSFAVVTGATTVVCSNFLTYAGCDLPSANGSHRVTWDTAADGYEALVASGSVKATLTYDVGTLSDSTYMVIDLSAGTTGEYPVRFIRTDLPTSVFNRDLYKTSRLVLKRIPAGSFWMGVGESTGVANKYGNITAWDGVSRQYVQLTDDYYLALFETTAQQYKLITGTAVQAKEVQRGPKFGFWWATTIAAAPFENLSNRTVCRGRPVTGFSLPTEAQWERACRAEVLVTYCNGQNFTGQSAKLNEMLGKFCMCKETGYYGPAVVTDGQGHAVVGQFSPNAWGFYDMTGNVCEWCSDWYAAYPVPPEGKSWDESNPLVDPTGPTTQPEGNPIHCLRGGCSDSGWNISSGHRQAFPGTPTSNNAYRNGFRYALTVK